MLTAPAGEPWPFCARVGPHKPHPTQMGSPTKKSLPMCRFVLRNPDDHERKILRRPPFMKGALVEWIGRSGMAKRPKGLRSISMFLLPGFVIASRGLWRAQQQPVAVSRARARLQVAV